jgi:hypothetical protein
VEWRGVLKAGGGAHLLLGPGSARDAVAGV